MALSSNPDTTKKKTTELAEWFAHLSDCQVSLFLIKLFLLESLFKAVVTPLHVKGVIQSLVWPIKMNK
jgi:hypothetical protein